jgi:hypothetical protein
MGTYIYGRTKQVKSVPVEGTSKHITVNLAKHLYKESWGCGRTRHQEKMLEGRYRKAWEGQELPKFFIMADSWSEYDEHDVHMAKRYGAEIGVTFADTCLPTVVVGTVRKIKGKYSFKPKRREVRRLGDMEPSCPECGNANALITSQYDEDLGRGLECRDCHAVVYNYKVVDVEPVKCPRCTINVWPTAKYCPNCKTFIEKNHEKINPADCAYGDPLRLSSL